MQKIYLVIEKGERGKVFINSAFTNENYAYDTLSNLRHDDPETYYYMEETDLYQTD